MEQAASGLKSSPLHPPQERRNRLRLQEEATIEVRYGKRAHRYQNTPLIESSRHGARVVLAGKPRRDESVDFTVHIGRNSFAGLGRVAWSVPLSNGRSIVGLEFLTFSLKAA